MSVAATPILRPFDNFCGMNSHKLQDTRPLFGIWQANVKKNHFCSRDKLGDYVWGNKPGYLRQSAALCRPRETIAKASSDNCPRSVHSSYQRTFPIAGSANYILSQKHVSSSILLFKNRGSCHSANLMLKCAFPNDVLSEAKTLGHETTVWTICFLYRHNQVGPARQTFLQKIATQRFPKR